MRQFIGRFLMCGVLAAGLSGFAGCASDDTAYDDRDHDSTRVVVAGGERTEPIPMEYAWAEEPPTTQRVVVEREQPRRVERDRGDMDSSAVGRFAEGGAVVLEMHAPREVRVGEAFEYRIHAINKADYPVHNVVVTETIPANFQVSETRPQAQESEQGKLRWELGTLNENETRVIRIAGQASGAEQLVSCATVSYEPRVCVVTNVVAPTLTLRVSGPEEVLLCENIPLTFEVTNTGTGTAMGVNIRDELPQGVVVAENSANIINVPVGNLAAGQSRQFQVYIKPLDRGTYQFDAMARSEDGLVARTEAGSTKVTEPVLSVALEAPQQQFIGTDITYRLTVANKGDAAARDTIVTQQVPAGARLVNATDNGRMDNGRITWNLGNLPINETRELTYTLQHTQPGQAQMTASARAYCARAVDATEAINIEGIPGLLLEVVDNNDPIQVGQNVTYVITVVNQGSAVDTGIRIRADLEPTMEFVSVEGPTRGEAQGDGVVFEPLARLNPQERATWRLTVKANDAGHNRFGLTLNSDKLGDRPVQETEATHFFK